VESPRSILSRRGLRPKYSWGQNFLGDPDALEQIAAALQLQPGERVVELGPGLGHLTRFLLETGALVTAVERDRDMVEALGELRNERLTVVAANAAQVDFARLAQADKVAVVGNLPYHLTSPILFSVLEQHARISRAVNHILGITLPFFIEITLQMFHQQLGIIGNHAQRFLQVVRADISKAFQFSVGFGQFCDQLFLF